MQRLPVALDAAGSGVGGRAMRGAELMVRTAGRLLNRTGSTRGWRGVAGLILVLVLLPAAALAQQMAAAPEKSSAARSARPSTKAPASTLQPVFTLPAPPFTIPFLPSPVGDWIVSVGAGAEYKPDFVGSKRYMFSPVPVFSIRRAGSPEKFRSPIDSASLTLFDYAGFHAGPVAKFVAARNAADFAELRGLGNVGAAIELGGFVDYFPVDWLRLRAEIRQGFFGHGGVTANLSSDVIVPISQGLTLSGGPRFTLASTGAIAPYFSVNPVQAALSGLPVFNARGGAQSAGAGAQLRYRFNPQWEVHSYVEYQRLLGDVAASPLVRLRGSADQVTVGIGASYSFDVRVQ
jgi:MipA family protein